jgi:hypothetical protein
MPSPRRLGKGRVQFIGEQGWRDSRRTMTKFLPLAGILAVLASPTLAVPPKAPAAKAAPREATRADMAKRFDARFAQIDTNKDGSLSRAEVDAARASFVGLTGKVITGSTPIPGSRFGTFALARRLARRSYGCRPLASMPL